MQEVKRRFFAMRNGAVADSLRRQGAPYRIIFGLNLPQIVEIARDFAPDNDLALQLRDNTATRESMLLAPMLYDRADADRELAVDWLTHAPTTEVIDVACLKLFRYLPDAPAVVDALEAVGTPLARYASLRLGANILPAHIDRVEQIAQAEADRRDPLTATAARMILDDIAWRRESAAD